MLYMIFGGTTLAMINEGWGMINDLPALLPDPDSQVGIFTIGRSVQGIESIQGIKIFCTEDRRSAGGIKGIFCRCFGGVEVLTSEPAPSVKDLSYRRDRLLTLPV